MNADPAMAVENPFGRAAELAELQQKVRSGKSFLLHGESGAGKTHLIKIIAPKAPHMLYCADSANGQRVFESLARALVAARDPRLRHVCGRSGIESIQERPTLRLRGLVRDALREGRYSVVLDHLTRTSASLASDVRDLICCADTQVIAIARSAHMEDLGFLSSWFVLKSDRMAIRPFTPALASEFAELVAEQVGFWADNRGEFLRKVVELSGGLPGNIVSLIKMALLPRYRSSGHVKTSPLYIDFRLAWHAANAY